MGIEKFFSSIQENNITNLDNPFSKKLEKNIDCTHLYIDFNSIVHKTSSIIVNDLNRIIFHIINGDTNNPNIATILTTYDIDPSLLDPLDPFPHDYVGDLIIDRTMEYLKNIITNYVIPHGLETLYIAIDGVPSKSKIMEQKKRRYIGAFTRIYKDKLFEKYEDRLKNDNIRYRYETSKIHFDKINISPGTIFMDKLNKQLSGINFETTLKELCPKIKTYIYSGMYEPGEGEKKIVDHLRSTDQKYSKYVIYSPDSDVTLLSLLLNVKDHNGHHISTLQLLRMNQQRGDYDIIDIDKLSANIFNFVDDKLSKGIKRNKDNIIKDIVFIFTIFGNDFLPKIESFDVKYDFNTIINKYIELLNNGEYIIQNVDGINKLKFGPFVNIFKILAKDEDKQLQKVYISSHFHNYKRLKRILEVDDDNFISTINTFLENLRNFNGDIKKNKRVEPIIQKWIGRKDFIIKLSKMVRFGIDDPNAFIRSYYKEYEMTNRLPKVRISFEKYNNSIIDEYHREKIKSTLIDNSLVVTKYDEETYQFENMLDQYTVKLNAQKLDLGNVYIDTHSYTFKTENFEKSIQSYYNDFFGIQKLDSQGMKDLIDGYIEGLVWVFDYYFNNFDGEQNRNHALTWFYKYSRSPLLQHIYTGIRERDQGWLDNIYDGLTKYRTPMMEYFNCLEHFMYASPIEAIMDYIPKEYNEAAKLYPSGIYDAINEIFKRDTNDEIDCRGANFLSKCHLNAVYNNINDDRKFIKSFRDIKLEPSTTRRKGAYSVIPNVKIREYGKLIGIDTLGKSKRGPKGGGLYKGYITNRRLYLKTGELKYKIKYKLYKRQLL